MDFLVRESSSINWRSGYEINENKYICSYCNSHTSSTRGLPLMEVYGNEQYSNNGVYICTHCEMPFQYKPTLQYY